MSNIEKLYYNMEKLTDNWNDMPEKKAANEKLEEAVGQDFYLKYEDVICDCMVANEKQGFILGFQYAVSLLTGGKTVAV